MVDERYAHSLPACYRGAGGRTIIPEWFARLAVGPGTPRPDAADLLPGSLLCVLL